MNTKPNTWRGLKRTPPTTGTLLRVCGLTPASTLRRCLEHRQESESANRVLNQLSDDMHSANDHIEPANKEGESANGLAPLALMAFIWLDMAHMAHRETA